MAEKPFDLERAKQLFHEALAKPTEERSSFLERVCGDDLTLRTQVETLLRANEEAGEFLSDPTATMGKSPDDVVSSEEVGSTVGPSYAPSLAGEIGHGASRRSCSG